MNLTTILATEADTVPAETILALIQPDAPERTATRLRILASDHPDGVPVELLDLERRREVEYAFMVAEGLAD